MKFRFDNSRNTNHVSKSCPHLRLSPSTPSSPPAPKPPLPPPYALPPARRLRFVGSSLSADSPWNSTHLIPRPHVALPLATSSLSFVSTRTEAASAAGKATRLQRPATLQRPALLSVAKKTATPTKVGDGIIGGHAFGISSAYSSPVCVASRDSSFSISNPLSKTPRGYNGDNDERRRREGVKWRLNGCKLPENRHPQGRIFGRGVGVGASWNGSAERGFGCGESSRLWKRRLDIAGSSGRRSASNELNVTHTTWAWIAERENHVSKSSLMTLTKSLGDDGASKACRAKFKLPQTHVFARSRLADFLQRQVSSTPFAATTTAGTPVTESKESPWEWLATFLLLISLMAFFCPEASTVQRASVLILWALWRLGSGWDELSSEPALEWSSVVLVPVSLWAFILWPEASFFLRICILVFWASRRLDAGLGEFFTSFSSGSWKWSTTILLLISSLAFFWSEVSFLARSCILAFWVSRRHGLGWGGLSEGRREEEAAEENARRAVVWIGILRENVKTALARIGSLLEDVRYAFARLRILRENVRSAFAGIEIRREEEEVVEERGRYKE